MKRMPGPSRTTGPRSAVVAAVCLFTALPARAQEPPDTFALDPILVTAMKVAAPRSAVPAAVTVIEGARLRADGVRFVADALRSVPGLSVVQTGSRGGLTSVFVRGAESDHVQVLIDGVPVNDPGGAVDLANLTTADVERIEVVRGPASVLYGSDAAAGVIQIITRRGSGPARVHAAVGASRAGRVAPDPGSAAGYDASASITGGGARSGWALTVANSRDTGARALNNRFASTTFSGALELRPAAGTGITASLRRADGRYHFPTDGGGALVDANQFRDAETVSASVGASHGFGPGLELRAQFASTAADYRLDDAPDGPGDTLGFYAFRSHDRLRRQRFDVHANVRSGATTVTVGATAERQRSETDLTSSSAFGPFQDRSGNRRSSHAGYAQLLATPASGVSVTAGSRLEESARYGALGTWRAGINLHGSAGTIRVAAGTGFKEPTFYENFATGFVRGNPALRPERTRSLEIGVSRDLAAGAVRLEAGAFLQHARNLIQYTAEPPAPGASNYFNVGRATASGLELAARLNAARGLSFDVAFTLLRTRVGDAGFGTDRAFLEGRSLLRRAPYHASIAASWLTEAGRLHGDVTFVGARADLDFSDPGEFAGTRVTLPAYARVDLGWERTLLDRADGPGLDLTASVHNLLDRRYQEVVNFPAARRTIRIGIRTGT